MVLSISNTNNYQALLCTFKNLLLILMIYTQLFGFKYLFLFDNNHLFAVI